MLSLQREAQDQPAGTLVFEAVEDGKTGQFGSRCVAKTKLASGRAVNVQVQLPSKVDALRYGDAFKADASLASPPEKNASRMWQQGVCAVATVSSVKQLERRDVFGMLLGVRNAAVDAMQEVEGNGSAVLQALVCAYRVPLDETGEYESFKTCGLAHVVAVSGAHLVIVCALTDALLKALRAPKAIALIMQLAFMLCYLALAAAPVSAIRSAVMAGTGMVSYVAKRRPSALNALGVCMMALIALDPSASVSVSLALSALSTLGILLFADLAMSWISRCIPRAPRFAVEAFSLTLASGVVVQPISAALFSQMSIVSPLANILVAPLLPLVCGGGLIAALATVVAPAAGEVLLQAASLGADALCAIVRVCASIPYASVPVSLSFEVGFALASVSSVLLWLCWPRFRPRTILLSGIGAATFFVICVFVMPRFAGDEIVMLDVGQGDAFLVRSGGVAMLVDTGNQDALLREALARHGVFRLDAIVISHGDDDHCGSLASLAGVVRVDRVLVARDALACGCESCGKLRASAEQLVGKENVQGVSLGDELKAGAFDLRVVWPKSFSDEGGNADSVCLLAQVDFDADGKADWDALFTGDAESEQLSDLLDAELVSAVDVFKVGHHGSKKSLTPELLERLSPRLALVSVGASNRYGHPARETIDALENAGCRVARTDEAGDVSCKLSSSGMSIEALR